MLWLLAAVAGLVAAAWFIGAREPVFTIGRGAGVWFVALKRNQARALDLAPGVAARWAAEAELPFIGASETYWTHFYVLASDQAAAAPLALDAGVDDAFIARLDLLKPPALALGVLRILIALGVLSKPRGALLADAQALGYRADLMPSGEAIAALTARGPDFSPAMVNFLSYYPAARYPDQRASSGRAAYRRYGRVAMRTVYRTGGHLLFYGRVREIVRQAQAGPCVGRWDDIAAMRYNRPEGILSMEHAPDYRDALIHRDAGLDRTIVIASQPLPGGRS